MAGEGFLPPIIARLLADTKEFETKMLAAGKQAESMGSSTDKMSKIGGAAFLALGAAAVAFVGESVHAAMEYETAHARLTTAVNNTGSATADWQKKVEETDAKMRHLGFTDTQTEDSLSRLTTATGNVQKAQSLMGLAADISRARNMDLMQATNLLVKVEGGRYTLLGRQLGLSKEMVASIHNEHQAVDLLTKMFHGQGEAYTKTFAGRMSELKAEADHVAVIVGEKVIPVITGFMHAIVDVVGWLDKHRTAALALGVAIGGPLVVAMGTFIAMKVAAFLSTVIDLLATAATGFAGLAAKITLASDAEATFIATGAGGTGIIGGAGQAVGVLASGVSMLGDAIPPAAVALATLTDNSQNHSKAVTEANKQLAQFTVEANKTTDPVGYLNAKLKEQQGVFHDLMKETHNMAEANDMDHYSKTLDQTIIAGLTKLTQKQRDEVAQSAQTAAEIESDNAGIAQSVLQTYQDQGPQALKKFQDAVTKSDDIFGKFATAVMANSGMSTTAMDDLIKAADSMDKKITSSFQSSTDIVSAFGNQTQVTGKDFMTELNTEKVKAQEWANDLTTAAKVGVDQGLLQKIAEAGPKSEGMLKGLLDAVAHGNLQAINQTQTDETTMQNNIIAMMNSKLGDWTAAGAAAGHAWTSAVIAGMGQAVSGVASAVSQAQQTAMAGIHNLFNNATTAGPFPAPPPGYGSTLGPPRPNSMGGLVTTPTNALVGEAGPEVILPLNNPGRTGDLLRAAGLGGGGGGGDTNVTVVVVKSTADALPYIPQQARARASYVLGRR